MVSLKFVFKFLRDMTSLIFQGSDFHVLIEPLATDFCLFVRLWCIICSFYAFLAF